MVMKDGVGWMCSCMLLGLVYWVVVKWGSGPDLLWTLWGTRKRTGGTCRCVQGMGGCCMTAVRVNSFGLGK